VKGEKRHKADQLRAGFLHSGDKARRGLIPLRSRSNDASQLRQLLGDNLRQSTDAVTCRKAVGAKVT